MKTLRWNQKMSLEIPFGFLGGSVSWWKTCREGTRKLYSKQLTGICSRATVRSSSAHSLRSVNLLLIDPTPFLQMSASSRETHPKTVFLPAASMPPPPLPGQVKGAIAPCSSLYPRPRDSYLRNFVREKRAQLVEPVLARATAFLATFGPDSDSENEAEQPGIGKYKRSKAHGNKADVVRRRRQEEAAMIRPRGPGGVFIKRDKAQANGATPSAPSRSRQKRSTPHSPDLNNGTASFPVPPQRRRRTSSVSSVHSFMEIDESAGCKPKRTRRPSSRFMNGSSNAISRSQTTSGKSADFAVPGDMPAPTPKVKLTIRLPPRSSLTVRKPELSPATSPSSTNSLRYRTASTSTSASTSRHSFSPPAFSFSPKIDGGDGEDEMQDYEYSSGAEVDDESRIGYDDDAMSVSTIAATSHSRSRTRSVTPRHFDFSGYSGFGGKTVSTPSTSGHKGANGKGKEKARTRGRTKPKPETFNLPWSVSEQHLLEKLLVDYPDGSHNRWVYFVL